MAILCENLEIPSYGITLPEAYIEVVKFEWRKPSFTADIVLHVWANPENSKHPEIRPFEIYKQITFDNNFQTPLIQQMVDDVESKIITGLEVSGVLAEKTTTVWIEELLSPSN